MLSPNELALLEAIRDSGKSAAELALEYRLPEDYIAAALAAGPEAADETEAEAEA